MGKSRLLVLLTLGICAVARAADPPAADPLDIALEQRIRGKAGLGDVEIAASWQRDTGSRSARVWGSGVGIWQDRTQFRLSRDEVVSLLKILSAARVGAMPQPGAKAPASRTPAVEPPKSPLRLLGELTLAVGSERKSFQQLIKGEQSEPLRDVVLAILSFCEKAAKDGVTVSSLPDGLGKLAAGTLAPETFEAIVQRREDSKGGSAAESWILRINGLRVTDRLMPKGQAPPPPRALTLSREEFVRLARLIEENEPGALPGNVFAPAYTDVRIEVLGEGRTIPARAYLGVTSQTHGAKQKSFDRLYDVFRALHERTQEHGKLVVDPERDRSAERARQSAKPAPTSSPAAP